MINGLLLSGLATVLIGFFYIKTYLKKQIIFEYESALLFKNGKFIRILEPGKYWIWQPTATIQKAEQRLRVLSLPGQEILTADNITIKISLSSQYQVSDVKKAILGQESYTEVLHATLQLVLREIITSVTVDNLLGSRNEIGKKTLEICSPKLESIGLKLHTVDVKDIMFPGELKKVFAKVVEAQKEGLAILEKARGETAALRQLANAAKLLEENPSLMQLRMLQSSGHTFVIGASEKSILPVKPQGK